MYRAASTWLLFSRGEREVIELLDKARRMYKHLPTFLQLKLTHDPEKEMRFGNYSSIKAFAATETGGISYDASGIVCDEWDYHPFAEGNYINAKPAMEDGGQFIGITTVDILNPDTHAKTIFQDALKGKNEFTPLFFPYTARPGRDEKWYEEKKSNIPESELGNLTPELYMFQNYPRSIEEAFSVPQTVAAFDVKSLGGMMEDVRNPVHIDEIDNTIIKIYKPFSIGNFYIAASDTSHGVGKDYSVTVIMNVRTGEIVADIMHQLLSPEELAYHSVKLLKLYKNPRWYPENNEWGRTVIIKAQELGYTNFGYQDDKKRRDGQEGWKTDSKTRFELFGELIPAINNRQITIYNKAGIKQFYDIIRNADAGGRIEAMQGRHDDYPIAVGICWARKKEVDSMEWNPETIETLHFARRKSETIQAYR